jgi:hypothetical protein
MTETQELLIVVMAFAALLGCVTIALLNPPK